MAKYHIYQFYISFCDCKIEYWFLRGPHLLHYAGFSRFVEELFVFFLLNEKHIKIGKLFIFLIEFERKTNKFDKLFIHNSSGKRFLRRKEDKDYLGSVINMFSFYNKLQVRINYK